MPIIKSAKKALKQSLVKRERNFRVRRTIKETLKELTATTKTGDVDAAQKMLSKAYKVIDTAAKKNILHNKNAARKKSSLANLVAHMSTTPVDVKAKGPKVNKNIAAKKSSPKKSKATLKKAK